MHYQRYVTIVLFILTAFVIANYLVWKLWTEDLITNTKYQGGDLTRMGYLHKSKDFRKEISDLPRRHINIKDYDGRKIDILTIGDSFSNGGAGGRNRFYQDYIASINNFETLNIPRYRTIDPLTTISIFFNNGYLDKMKPKYILIGIDEKRPFEEKWPTLNFIDLDRSIEVRHLKNNDYFDYYTQPPNPRFINNGNLKFILYNFLYLFYDHAPSGVYRHQLKSSFFSVPDGNVLLFLKNKRLPTTETVQGLNNSLNKLSEKLAKKGITLVFMPCVEKYNLYSSYLVNSHSPHSTFFEILRPLHKNYLFIDTKAILTEELRKGEKDIFYADDTHWGWKASEKIFSTFHLNGRR